MKLWFYYIIFTKKDSLLNKIVGFIFLIIDFNYIPLKQ